MRQHRAGRILHSLLRLRQLPEMSLASSQWGTPQTWSTPGGATIPASAGTDVLAVCPSFEVGTEQTLKWFFGAQHREESSGSCSFV